MTTQFIIFSQLTFHAGVQRSDIIIGETALVAEIFRHDIFQPHRVVISRNSHHVDILVEFLLKILFVEIGVLEVNAGIFRHDIFQRHHVPISWNSHHVDILVEF